ncbi:hypothetical protein LCGC14_0894810 [marine sediment metagenome]|uniref:Neck protein n=1 Tax=marine sediment metagenome TaxID=412755 RepID=A0A0F9RHH2_9ZZZZ
MSAKLDIFNDIVTALAAVTEIETIELWNSQLTNEDREIPFNYNAVFIEFADIPWTTTNQQPSRLGSEGDVSKQQKGDGALITLHIAFSPLQDETVSFPIISPIIDKVYFAVQGLDNNFYGPLLRVAERQDTDHDRVIDWQMDFNTMIFECGELDDSLTEIPGGTVDVDVNVDLDIDNDIIRTGDGQ